MARLIERLREALRDLWERRPIIVTFVNFENQRLNGYSDGFISGLTHERAAERVSVKPSNVIEIHAMRTTSTGVILSSVGAA